VLYFIDITGSVIEDIAVEVTKAVEKLAPADGTSRQKKNY